MGCPVVNADFFQSNYASVPMIDLSLSLTDLCFHKFRWYAHTNVYRFTMESPTNPKKLTPCWLAPQASEKDPHDATLFANRSLCWLRLGDADMLCLMLGVAKGCVLVGPKRGTVRVQLWACCRYIISCKFSLAVHLISPHVSISPWWHPSMCRTTKEQSMHSRKPSSLNLKMARSKRG